MKKLLLFFLILLFFTVPVSAQEYKTIVEKNLSQFSQLNNIPFESLQWEVTNSHVSRTSGTTHIYLNQLFDGIKILGTESSLHVLSKDRGITFNNNFITNIDSFKKYSSNTNFNALRAVNILIDHFNYSYTKPLSIIKKEKGDKEILIGKGDIADRDIKARLMYMKTKNDLYELVWDITFLEKDLQHWWQVKINANNGKIENVFDRVSACHVSENEKIDIESSCASLKAENYNLNLEDCNNCYEVIEMPNSSPYIAERTIAINPSNDIASPYGWHDTNGIEGAEHEKTEGNNVYAFIANQIGYGFQASGGTNLNFSGYEFDQNISENNYFQEASVTNLFYWTNIMHDIFYTYGFDESAGNFQYNNYNRGGYENDRLIARSQIITSNNCIATFGTSIDGEEPYINISICDTKDGSFDNEVIIHEYGHGISSRLVAGPSTVDCLFNLESMREGWSDFFGILLTIQPGDNRTTNRGMANYYLNLGVNGNGIRDYPYSTDFNVNPSTYDSIKTAAVPHGVGAVWGTMLWDLTWDLIDIYGYDANIYNYTGDINKDAGNIMALAIVTESLKYADCWPGFVRARENIIVASRALYGDVNECLIWETFARRGLGFSAIQGSPTSTTDGAEAFDLPPQTANFIEDSRLICYRKGIIQNLGGGFPVGGLYHGNGVTDNGNGITYTLDIASIGIGKHNIYYEIDGSNCTIPSTSSMIIDVFDDEIPPTLNCPINNIRVLGENENSYILEDFTSLMNIYDNCEEHPLTNQEPYAGNEIGIGETLITISSSDVTGNQTICEFYLSVRKEKGENDLNLLVYPIPSEDLINIKSNLKIDSMVITIYSISGIELKSIDYEEFDYLKSINIEDLVSGFYILKMEMNDKTVIKKIIKN